ncbi:MAG: hypothetical protein J0I41_05055 [Filimonas sp.]|nr:hypothetical protein [Filimonas sp.]
MKLKTIITTVFLISLFASCKKEDLTYDMPAMGGNQIQPLPLDLWIRDTLNIPYNISVKYKWDASELDLYKTLVPPMEQNIIPVLQAVNKVWVSCYIQEAGLDFFKEFCPKQFVLVGSANYETDGTTILATAEAGRKVVLYDVNNFDKTSATSVVKLLHIIEHEFTHILHQHVMYPTSYKLVTPGAYTSAWKNFTTLQANNQGFITPYAMNTPDEDIAEMVSTMLTTDRSKYDAMINGIVTASARDALRAKESIIVGYFSDVYGIDFYSLQSRTVAAIKYVTTH